MRPDAGARSAPDNPTTETRPAIKPLRAPPPLFSPIDTAPRDWLPVDPEKERDRARAAEARDTLRNLYWSKRWRDPVTGMRARILARDGYACRFCGVTLAGHPPAPESPVVDHIEPHRGNLVLFWDESNLQALCKACHDGAKQRQDKARMRPPGGGSKV